MDRRDFAVLSTTRWTEVVDSGSIIGSNASGATLSRVSYGRVSSRSVSLAKADPKHWLPVVELPGMVTSRPEE